MKTNINTRALATLRLALVLSLTASTAFGVEFRAITLNTLPTAAVVVTPKTGIPLGLPPAVFSLISQNQTMASQLVEAGPVVILDAGRGVMMIPQTIRPGAKALVMPQDGGKATLVPITQTMATALRQQMKDGDVSGAAKTLGHTFDASLAAAPTATAVVVPETAGKKAPAAKLTKGSTKTKTGKGTKTPPAPTHAAPVVVAQTPDAAIPAPLSSIPSGEGWSDADLLNPAKRPTLKYGDAVLPIIAAPSEGAVISDLWRKAHAQANSALIVAYNFDDMAMAQDIVAKAKAGEKITFIGDYSNWFPERMPQAKSKEAKDGKAPSQTAAMQFIIANLPAMGANFDFHILKGLGDIGINHNKFTVFRGPNGKLLQGGSFNYSMNSQTKHWELVVFTDDAQRIDAFERYGAWLTRRARKYSPDLQPADPTFDSADPIPTVEASAEISLHGVPFPKVMFSPNGPGEAALTKAITLVQQHLGILMFSPFPTPQMVAAIEGILGKKIKADMVADASQVDNATPIVGLADHGMPIKDIHGPDVELRHEPITHGSFEHEKDMLFDADMADGIVKMADSLNISGNAFNHNFENIQLWSGFYARYLAAHYRYLQSLAHDLPPGLIEKLREKLANEHKPAGSPAA